MEKTTPERIQGYRPSRTRKSKNKCGYFTKATCAALLVCTASTVLFSSCTRSGWSERSGGICYFDPAEKAYVCGMREIDGNTYCFGDDARLLYGWISYGGGLYYSGQDGAVCKGETMIDGHTYCFDTVTGLLVTGWCENNGKRQYRLYDGTPASGILTWTEQSTCLTAKVIPHPDFHPRRQHRVLHRRRSCRRSYRYRRRHILFQEQDNADRNMLVRRSKYVF